MIMMGLEFTGEALCHRHGAKSWLRIGEAYMLSNLTGVKQPEGNKQGCFQGETNRGASSMTKVGRGQVRLCAFYFVK